MDYMHRKDRFQVFDRGPICNEKVNDLPDLTGIDSTIKQQNKNTKTCTLHDQIRQLCFILKDPLPFFLFSFLRERERGV